MAGILSGLLALFGLGGCKQEEPPLPPEVPQMLDGPGSYFDLRTSYIGIWESTETGQTLHFTEESLLLKAGEEVLWEGPWEITMIDGYMYGAQGENEQAVGDYAYFLDDYFTRPEDASPDDQFLAAHRVNGQSEEDYVLFRRSAS
jgi:hypothetical protein